MSQKIIQYETNLETPLVELLDDKKNQEKHEFNAHLITIFYRMDRDRDGVLQGDELPGRRYGGKQHERGDVASDPAKNS